MLRLLACLGPCYTVPNDATLADHKPHGFGQNACQTRAEKRPSCKDADPATALADGTNNLQDLLFGLAAGTDGLPSLPLSGLVQALQPPRLALVALRLTCSTACSCCAPSAQLPNICGAPGDDGCEHTGGGSGPGFQGVSGHPPAGTMQARLSNGGDTPAHHGKLRHAGSASSYYRPGGMSLASSSRACGSSSILLSTTSSAAFGSGTIPMLLNGGGSSGGTNPLYSILDSGGDSGALSSVQESSSAALHSDTRVGSGAAPPTSRAGDLIQLLSSTNVKLSGCQEDDGGGGEGAKARASVIQAGGHLYEVVHMNSAALALFRSTQAFEALLRDQLGQDLEVSTAAYSIAPGATRVGAIGKKWYAPAAASWSESLDVEAAACRLTSCGCPPSRGLIVSFRAPCEDSAAASSQRASNNSQADAKQQQQQTALLQDLTLQRLLIDHIAWPVAVLDMQGRILYQNASSRDYMALPERPTLLAMPTLEDVPLLLNSLLADGDVAGGTAAALSDLEALFRLEPQLLLDLHAAMREGREWRSVMKVPPRGFVFAEAQDLWTAAGQQADQLGTADSPTCRPPSAPASASSSPSNSAGRVPSSRGGSGSSPVAHTQRPTRYQSETSVLSSKLPPRYDLEQGDSDEGSRWSRDCGSNGGGGGGVLAAQRSVGSMLGRRDDDCRPLRRMTSAREGAGQRRWNTSAAEPPSSTSRSPSLDHQFQRLKLAPGSWSRSMNGGCGSAGPGGSSPWRPSQDGMHKLPPRGSADHSRRSMDLALTIATRSLSSRTSRAGRAVHHDVRANVVRDTSGAHARDLILLTHVDVTSEVLAEQRASSLLEAEHAILERLFPRHVIEHLTASSRLPSSPPPPPAAAAVQQQQQPLHSRVEQPTDLFDAAPMTPLGMDEAHVRLRGGSRLQQASSTLMAFDAMPAAVMGAVEDDAPFDADVAQSQQAACGPTTATAASLPDAAFCGHELRVRAASVTAAVDGTWTGSATSSAIASGLPPNLAHAPSRVAAGGVASVHASTSCRTGGGTASPTAPPRSTGPWTNFVPRTSSASSAMRTVSAAAAAAAGAAAAALNGGAGGVGLAGGGKPLRHARSLPVCTPTTARTAEVFVPGSADLSTSHEQVTIMFADIVGFTSMCKMVSPGTVMAFLNKLYSAFDELISIFNVYKIETAGDCYIVAGGLMFKDQDGYNSVRSDVDPLHALTVLEFAKALLQEARKMRNPVTGEPIQMRVGMHSGPVVSGIVGTKMPRFCLFGDSMNSAQRMESTSYAGAIHVSAATHQLLPDESWRPATDAVRASLGGWLTYLWAPCAAAAIGPVGRPPIGPTRSCSTAAPAAVAHSATTTTLEAISSSFSQPDRSSSACLALRLASCGSGSYTLHKSRSTDRLNGSSGGYASSCSSSGSPSAAVVSVGAAAAGAAAAVAAGGSHLSRSGRHVVGDLVSVINLPSNSAPASPARRPRRKRDSTTGVPTTSALCLTQQPPPAA